MSDTQPKYYAAKPQSLCVRCSISLAQTPYLRGWRVRRAKDLTSSIWTVIGRSTPETL